MCVAAYLFESSVCCSLLCLVCVVAYLCESNEDMVANVWDFNVNTNKCKFRRFYCSVHRIGHINSGPQSRVLFYFQFVVVVVIFHAKASC